MKSIPAAMIFGGGGSGSGSYTDLTHKPKINDVELSGNKSLTNLGLYSKTEVNNLLNDKADSTDVYTKTETDDLIPDISGKADKSTTYTKTEVNTLISTINQFNVEIVDELPTTDIDMHTIYFVPSGSTDSYNEYMYINSNWATIGSTEIDLSQYYTKTEADTLLDDKADSDDVYTKTETDTLLDDKVDDTDIVTSFGGTPSDAKIPSEKLVKAGLDGKADASVITLTDWNSLHEGLNAVLIPKDTVLDDFVAPNNLRGYIMKNGTNGNGCFSDYSDAHKYYLLYSEAFTYPIWRFNPLDTNTYSNSEKVIGTWIDGKPLYQRTFDAGYLPNNNRNNIADLTSCSIKYAVSITGFCYRVGDYTSQRPLPLVDINPDNSIRIDINSTDSKPYLRIMTGADWSGFKGYVTIKYTKTTD